MNLNIQEELERFADSLEVKAQLMDSKFIGGSKTKCVVMKHSREFTFELVYELTQSNTISYANKLFRYNFSLIFENKTKINVHFFRIKKRYSILKGTTYSITTNNKVKGELMFKELLRLIKRLPLKEIAGETLSGKYVIRTSVTNTALRSVDCMDIYDLLYKVRTLFVNEDR